MKLNTTMESETPSVTDLENQEDNKGEATNNGTSGLVSVAAFTGVVGFIAMSALVVGSVALAKYSMDDDHDSSIGEHHGQHKPDHHQPEYHTPELHDPTPMALELEGSTTLYKIHQRGKLNCGLAEVPGFAATDSQTGTVNGFDADLCRAVAAAIFLSEEEGDVDDYINFDFIRPGHWFEALGQGTFDLLAAVTTHTMERDVHHEASGVGFTFSVPYFYDGIRFGGEGLFLECADAKDVSGDCAALSICANDIGELLGHFPEENLVQVDAQDFSSFGAKDLTDALEAGDCNVIAGNVFTSAHLPDGYKVGTKQLTREPLALVTNDQDPRFSDFVGWILQAIFTADEQGVSQENHEQFADVQQFGMIFEGMMSAAVAAVGNYGEIYARHLEAIVPRMGMNEINSGNSGLIMSTPLGGADAEGPGPVKGGSLEAIKAHGHLNCGITRRAGFGEFSKETLKWQGFDVDYCKALSAAIFDGVPDHVVYHVLPATERFVAQAMGKVDVLSRITTYNLERDVHEPTSMQGFTFSQPVFYDGLGFGGLPDFAACADNLDTTTGVCPYLRICVNDGTTTIAGTRRLFPEENIVVKPTGEEALAGLVSGDCNAIAGGSHDLARASVESVGYTGDYAIGVNRYSKEPLALVTNQNDPQWSSFVYMVVTSTFYAEEQGINQTDAEEMPSTNLFGPLYTRMLKGAVGAVGNHGEIYARSLEVVVPRGGLNTLNDGSGPQIYALPGIPLAS